MVSLSNPKPENFDFAERLLTWFDQFGRHDLPWQHPRTPYRVWLSEIMLQQTQVNAVIPYFEQFLRAFPNLESLANAELDQVLKHWAGLGYYARARNLHRAARIIARDFNGQMPSSHDELLALPGIGRSTAGAIRAQAFDQRGVILDGNVKRVLTRYAGVSGWPGLPAVEQKLWQLAEAYTPQHRLADYSQAIMDLGATVCKRTRPVCQSCPVQSRCVAFQENRVSELPGSKPKKKLPTHERYIVLIVDAQDRLYLERRVATGIWGGLWSLPESAQNCSFDEAWSELQSRFQQRLAAPSPLQPIKHTFSHYHLVMKPLLCKLSNSQTVVAEENGLWTTLPIEHLGMPAPIEKFLAKNPLHQPSLV